MYQFINNITQIQGLVYEIYFFRILYKVRFFVFPIVGNTFIQDTNEIATCGDFLRTQPSPREFTGVPMYKNLSKTTVNSLEKKYNQR